MRSLGPDLLFFYYMAKLNLLYFKLRYLLKYMQIHGFDQKYATSDNRQLSQCEKFIFVIVISFINLLPVYFISPT